MKGSICLRTIEFYSDEGGYQFVCNRKKGNSDNY